MSRWWWLVVAACTAGPDGPEDVAGGATETDAADPETPTGGDTGPGDPPSDPLPQPIATCAPTASACDAGPAPAVLRAAYRKDAYFPDSVYDEYTDAPVDGGRVHVVGVAAVSGAVTALSIDGIDPESVDDVSSPGQAAVEWWHVWPDPVVAGEPVWVSFHSRQPAWDAKTSATLEVRTAEGAALDGSFPVATSPVVLTYVTTSDDGADLLIHVRNADTAPHTIDRVEVDGRDVTEAACVPDPVLPPGGAARITVTGCAPWTPGDVWTVSLTLTDGTPPAVGGGRVVPPFFPIEAWNNTSECPWPGGDDANATSIAAAGIDTHYLHGGVCAPDRCDCDTREVVEQVYGGSDTLRTVITDDVLFDLAPLSVSRGVAAVATGDESDGEIYEEAADKETYGVPLAARKARASQRAWSLAPELPTFNGGKTSGNIGTFAGIADVQGMDVYIGACAPHITRFGTHPPVRMPYDYLRNTRLNHLPLPTWLYSQGLSPAWGGDQPVASEILVQGLSVVAAGAKGLMWFQVNQEAAADHPEAWAAIEQVDRMVRAVRSRLRTGDVIEGGVTVTGDALADVIRAEDALIVPVIGLATTQAPTDLTCIGTPVPHVFAEQTVAITVTVPDDLGVVDVFEVRPDGVAELGAPFVAGRAVTVDGLGLSDAMPVRLVVLAASAGVRAEVEAARTW